MPKDDYTDSHIMRELEQEKALLKKINIDLKQKSKITQRKKEQLQQELEKFKHDTKELQMAKKFLENTVTTEKELNKKLSKKILLVLVCASLVVTLSSVSYSLLVIDLIGQEYKMANIGDIKSSYVIQNLRGDTIDTWLSWRLVEDAVIYVNVPDAQKYPDKLEIIKNVVLSDKVIEVDNSLTHKGPKGTTSLYYIGWAGALSKASEVSTELYIPKKFDVIESQRGEGDITIKLTTQKSGDGYSGYTKSIADETQNQILKSEITIFEVDKLSKAGFETILRHELGHALGLAHSSAPEDLMHPTIKTEFPYISECNIDAIISLYDGGKKSEVICEN
ncbi:matrixin family metalloprotease [Nitrosopumilus sp. S4]